MGTIAKKIIRSILRFEAEIILYRHKPSVIGVTGSVGKSSVKEAVWTIIKSKYTARKSPKSYNSEFGIPLTIIGEESAWRSPAGWAFVIFAGAARAVAMRGYPEYLVLEFGVDRPGDMDSLLALAPPCVGVVTAIGDVPVHVEYFDGPDALAKEKSKLVRVLNIDDSAVLNGDDEYVYAMKEKTSAPAITFGFGQNATVRASGYKVSAQNGISFKMHHNGESVTVRVRNVIGRQVVYSLLAASAAAIALDFNLIEISEALEKYKPLPGRLNILDGHKKTTLLDDTYNSSPTAALAALYALDDIKAKRKIAVLGDMLELGKYSADEHRTVGRVAREHADYVVAVGLRAKDFEGYDKWFADSNEAGDFMRTFIEEGDCILIKGSQGVHMEKITLKLLAQPAKAGELLVRQEGYWKNR